MNFLIPLIKVTTNKIDNAFIITISEHEARTISIGIVIALAVTIFVVLMPEKGNKNLIDKEPK